MALPARFLDELRARLPLSGFIGQHVQLQRAGREFKGCCPFHNEKTASFYINDVKGFYHCFGCGAHGDVISFAMNHLRLSFPEAIENLAAQAGLPVPERTQESKEQSDKRAHLYQCVESAAQFFTRSLHTPAGRAALDYLRGRSLTDETIAAWRLGFAPDDSGALIKHLTAAGYSLDEMLQAGLIRKSERDGNPFSFFRGRVMFPVTDIRERVVAFGARLLQGDGPKYINSSEHALFKKGDMLFGTAMARRTDMKLPLALVEGYMDVIALWQAGFAAVAPNGTALTENQLAILWRQAASRDAATPVLCFDGDNAGMRAAARALNLALPHITTRQSLNFVFLPHGEDPDSLVKTRGAEGFTQMLAQALPLYDVLWQQAIAGRTTTSPEDKAAMEAALAQAITPIKDQTLKRHYERETKDRLWQVFNKRPARDTKLSTTKVAGPANKASINRAAPLNADYMRAQVLLATLINHPALISEAEEWLLAQILPSQEQENIRKLLLEALQNQGLELDADSLKSYLSQRCGASVIAALLTKAYEHAGFSHPNSSLEVARIGWLDLQKFYMSNQIHEDIKIAARDLERQMTGTSKDDSNLSRINILQTELLNMPDTLSMMDDDFASRNNGSKR
ncbi:MAG: DNA primase [Bdellovibrionales bacterium]